MLPLLLGFGLGIVLTIVGLLVLAAKLPDPKQAASTPSQRVHEIEREAIRQMGATALLAELNGSGRKVRQAKRS